MVKSEYKQIFKMLSFRFLFQGTRALRSVRFCHNEKKELERPSSIQKSDEDRRLKLLEGRESGLMVQYWSERAALRKEKKENRFPRSVDNAVDFLRALQSIRNLPGTFTEMYYFLKRRRERKALIEQKYLPRRVALLRADLAAAHFIVNRGGSVKFLGQQQWIGYYEDKKMLPATYIPGLFIDSIKAERTGLIFEGLPNLSNLKYLRFLSLKNLETVNDWFMDWISKEYYSTLKNLDISGCVNVTYRGLSCFYRFECLETLNVEGIPSTVEFKLACLNLLEIMPYLDIQGIDLSIPREIDADFSERKLISDSNKQVQELKT